MQYLLVLFVIVLFSCNDGRKERQFRIGTYSFTSHIDFKTVKEDAFNTEVGRIVTDSFSLKYEYSSHTKDPILTPHEFIESDMWKADLTRVLFFEKGLKNSYELRFLSKRTADEKDSLIGKGCDFIVSCSVDSIVFDAPIYLPTDTKETRFIVDTIGNSYRKIFLANNPWEGRTGIYLQEIPKKAQQTNIYYSLLIWTEHLTKNQQTALLKILQTAKVIRGN